MTSLGFIGSIDGSGSSIDIVITQAVPVGGVVVVAGSLNSNVTATVTGPRGNTFSTTTAPTSGAPVVRCYAATAVITTALQVGDHLTITLSAASSKQAHVAAAWTGLTGSPVDKSGINAAGNSATASAGATGVLAQADEVLVFAVGTNMLAADTVTASGWTFIGSDATTSGTNDRRISLYEKTVASTASTTPQATLSPSTTWGSVLNTLKLSTTPPPTSPIKAWDGSAWVTGTAKAWDGSAWVTGTPKVWDGSAWTPA